MNFASLVGFSAAFHLYVGARLGPGLPGIWPVALAVLLVASAVLMPMGLLSRRQSGESGAGALAWAGLLFMGLFSSLFVGTVLRDVLLLLAWLVNLVGPSALPMESLKEWSAIAVPIAGLAVTFLGFLNARRTARVVTVPIAVADLPEALHGFRIVQISDVHVGPTIRARHVQAIVEAVNRLQPDLVAITGDLVDGSVADLATQVAPLAGLRSRHGSFFVTGNHEYYSGALPWIAHLGTLGIRVLHNEHVVIGHGDAKLLLAGVTDYSAGHFHETHRSDPHAAIAGAPADAALKVLLAHQPRSAAAAAKAGFDLQLSGHTHGGQFLPWNFFVKLQQPFTAGLHFMDELRIYVSRGTGYWGPPKRFFAPSEITELKLVPMA